MQRYNLFWNNKHKAYFFIQIINSFNIKYDPSGKRAQGLRGGGSSKWQESLMEFSLQSDRMTMQNLSTKLPLERKQCLDSL